MFGLSADKGISKDRLTWSRNITNEGQDQVVGVIPIPPGATLKHVYMNNLFVANESMDMKHATIIGLHAYLVGTSQPYHGYGKNSRPALDNMWDDLVPKDKPAGDSLTEGAYQDSSIADDDSQNSEVSQSPVSGNADNNDATGGSEFNVSTLNVTASQGPECIFARQKRLDITNGIIAKEQEFRAMDHCETTMSKNYHLSDDRYWWLMVGLSTPKIEVINNISWHPENDLEWTSLAFPEITVMEGLINQHESHSEEHTTFTSSLDSYFIDGGTYEDLGNASGLSNAVNYCDLVVTYKRPRFEGLRADVNRIVG